MRRNVLDFFESACCIAKGLLFDTHLLHHRQVESAHLSFGGLAIIQHSSGFDFPATFADHDNRKLGRIMATCHHARAKHDHRVVESGAFPFVDGLELSSDVTHLFEEELVDFQPVFGVGVGEEVVDHIVDPEVWESQGGVVVIEFEGGDACGIRLESEDEDVAHQSHMLGDVLGDTIGGAIDIGFIEGWFPALEFASFASVRDALFDIADGVEIFIEFALVAAADLTTDITGVFEDGIKYALIGAMVFVFEEAVEG